MYIVCILCNYILLASVFNFKCVFKENFLLYHYREMLFFVCTCFTLLKLCNCVTFNPDNDVPLFQKFIFVPFVLVLDISRNTFESIL